MIPGPTATPMAYWRWPLCAKRPRVTRDEPRARDRHHPRQGTAHRIPFTRIAGHHHRIRSDRNRPLQFYFRSYVLGIAPLRTGTFVAGVSFRGIAHVAAVLSARAYQ